MTTTRAFYRAVMSGTGFLEEEAKRATAAVLRALRDRLTPEEAAQAAEQLPRELKAIWKGGEVEGRHPIKMHRKEFYQRVRGEAALESERDARLATAVVFALLKTQLSPGEGEDILAQLPADLKAVWVDA